MLPAYFIKWLRNCVICLALLASFQTFGQDFLDHQFGTNGFVYPTVQGDPDGGITGVAVSADQKIVIYAASSVMKLKQNGSKDQSFSGNGVFILPANINNNISGTIYDVIIQPDDKIIIGGNLTTPNFDGYFLLRIKADGNGPDSSFGVNGVVNGKYFYTQENASCMKLQPDGKIIIAGELHDSIGIVRFLPNGSVDSAFGEYGRVKNHIGTFSNHPEAISLQTDGKIVIGAYGDQVASGADFIILRYLPNGNIDTSFNHTGLAYGDPTHLQPYGLLSDMTLQPNGKILASGRSATVSGGFLILRFNPDGTRDASFNAIGEQNIAIDGSGDCYKLKLQSDGKIIASGTYEGTKTIWGVIRLLTDGELDTSFGDDGIMRVPLTNSTKDDINDMDLQADEKILLGGNFRIGAPPDPNTHTEMILGRLLNDSPNGIENTPKQDNQVFCYPNPVNDWVMIHIPRQRKIISGKLLDINGVCVFENKLRNKPIPTAHLPDGIYQLRILLDDGKTTNHQLIINHEY